MKKMMTLLAIGAIGYTGFSMYKKYNPDYKKDVKEYVDKMAAVGATTATDLEELATAMSKVASAANSMGIGAEFTVMAGAMLGGVKMGGGGGKMSDMVIGTLIIGVLNSGMNFLNLNQYWQYVVLGIVLLAAVITDTMQTVAAANAAKKVTGCAPAEEKTEAAAE